MNEIEKYKFLDRDLVSVLSRKMHKFLTITCSYKIYKSNIDKTVYIWNELIEDVISMKFILGSLSLKVWKFK